MNLEQNNAGNNGAAAPVQDNAAQNLFFQNLVDQLRQTRVPAARSIPCETYKAGADFEQWHLIFRDSVKAVNGLQDNDPRLNELCVRWLPTKLELGITRSVYENLPQQTKDNWLLLRQALSQAYRDENEEIIFLSNEGAWKRTPGMSLRDYRNGLVTRMDKYQPNLRQVNEEWERNAVRRFRIGLENPVLDAHILMQCTGPRHTLQDAFTIACNFENTIHTISQSGNSKAAGPSIATMLNIPQPTFMADPPQLGALGSQEKERFEKRFETLEISSKKSEMDVKELQAGLSEVKETVKSIKEDLTQPKYPRPVYQRQVRPFYPVARMPVSNPFVKPFYPQYNRPTGIRPQGVVPGLTGGPGFVTRQPAPAYSKQANQTDQSNQKSANTQNIEKGRTDTNQRAPSQRPPTPAIGVVEESEDAPKESAFPNPHLQYGAIDQGHGWVEMDSYETNGLEYDTHPEGAYFYSPGPPF